jgi:hypothetical protein
LDELAVAARPRPPPPTPAAGEEIEGGFGKRWTGEERRANPREGGVECGFWGDGDGEEEN